MPLYDFMCNKCKLVFEAFSKIDNRNEERCPQCKSETTIVLSNVNKKDWFKPHYSEHFTGEPILVESKRHMKKLCLKHDVTSRALGDVRNCYQMGKRE